jgi:hypothetical protein
MGGPLTMATAKKIAKWRITLVRKKGERLGTVEAADADEAVKVAIKTFEITDRERQRRLVAQRIS